MRRETTRRGGFTLIELLTVMAIIVLLIGILTPALSGARNRATKTAIQAQINAMAVGLEAFKSDEGEFPPSNPVLMANDILNERTMLDQEMNDWEVGTQSSPRWIGRASRIWSRTCARRWVLRSDHRSRSEQAGSTTSWNGSPFFGH